MKRDMFKRPTRMVHHFGATEKINDPLGANTFDYKPPMAGSNMPGSSPGFSVQSKGVHDMFSPVRSPVQKPNGKFASINGPEPDYTEQIAAPIPVSTKKRVGHLKTDK